MIWQEIAVKGGESWSSWRMAIWDTFMEKGFDNPGMVAFEQWALRSKREKRCIDCGKPGVVKQRGSGFCAAVSHYWMCQDCHDYWQSKK